MVHTKHPFTSINEALSRYGRCQRRDRHAGNRCPPQPQADLLTLSSVPKYQVAFTYLTHVFASINSLALPLDLLLHVVKTRPMSHPSEQHQRRVLECQDMSRRLATLTARGEARACPHVKCVARRSGQTTFAMSVSHPHFDFTGKWSSGKGLNMFVILNHLAKTPLPLRPLIRKFR